MRATAARDSLHSLPRPRQTPALGNPLVAPLRVPRAAKARPVASCVPEQRPAPLSKSCRLAGVLRNPLWLLPSMRPPGAGPSISRMCLSFHHFQQKFSCRVQPRPHRPCWNSKHRAHIGSVHFFNERKLQDTLEFLRQAFYFPPEPLQQHLLLRVLRSVNHRSRLGHLPRRISCQPAPVASLPVQRQPKNDPVYPPAEFLRFAQRCKLLIGPQERFLCDIFCVGGIAQDTVSNLKNSPLIFSDTLAKSRLGTTRFSSCD